MEFHKVQYSPQSSKPVYLGLNDGHATPHVNIAGFADNITLNTHCLSPKKAVNWINNAAEQIISKLEKLEIKVNATKTETLHIAKLRDIPRVFKIRGTKLEFKQCV